MTFFLLDIYKVRLYLTSHIILYIIDEKNTKMLNEVIVF